MDIKRLVVYALCASLAAPAWSAETAPLRGYSAEAGAHGARVGSEVPRHPRSRQPARLHAAPLRAAASRRLALRQGQRRVDRSPSSRSGGSDAQIETFDVLFPTPKERALEMVEPDALHGEARGARRRRRSHLGAAERAAARLQRLLDRWRRHRAAGLRELRHPGRLRRARAPRHLGEGRHRDRALRRIAGAASSPRSPANTARSAA